MSVRKIYQLKIIHTQHELSVEVGQTIGDIMNDMNQLSRKGKIIHINFCGDAVFFLVEGNEDDVASVL